MLSPRLWIAWLLGSVAATTLGALTPTEDSELDDLANRTGGAPDAVIAAARARLDSGPTSDEFAGRLWFLAADAHLQKGDFAGGDETARQALETLGDRLPPALHADLLGIRAALPWRQGDLPNALGIVLRAYRLAQVGNEGATLARCANRLGVLYSNLGRPDEALVYYQEALDLDRIRSAPPARIASTLGNIGLLYHSLENYPDAVDYQTEAVELYRAASDPFGLARNTINLAITRNQLGESSAALALVDEAVATQREIEDTRGLTSGLLARALILNTLERPAEALATIDEVMPMLEEQQADSERIDAFVITARAQRALGHDDEALATARTGAALATEVGIVNAISNIQRLLAEILVDCGDHAGALLAERAAAAAQREQLDARRQELVTVLEIQHEVAERERALAQLRAENAEQALGLEREQHLRRNAIAGIAAAAIALLGLLYGYRLKHRHARQLGEANEQLSLLNAEKSALMDIAAHDLRSPLTAVRWQAEAQLRADEASLSATTRTALANIAATAGTMHTKVTQLLDSQRVDSGQPLSEPQNLDLAAWLPERAAAIADAAAAKSITVESAVTAGLIARDVPPEELSTIVDNLLSNAVKFSPTGTSVRIVAERNPQQRIVLSVSDQGPGIPLAEQPHLFAKYNRLSPRPTAGETSTGLGLAIVKRLADRLGIEIAVDSTPGRGTRFTLRFPATA